MKRGDDWFRMVGRIAVQVSRSSDGEWSVKGRTVGFFHIVKPYQGAAPHDDKWGCGIVVGEYSVLFGWYPKKRRDR